MLEVLVSPDQVSRCRRSEIQNTDLLSVQSGRVLWELSERQADNCVRLQTVSTHLSVSVLTGGGVDLVGDVTGLVSTGDPFRRPALTSAILCGSMWALSLTGSVSVGA